MHDHNLRFMKLPKRLAARQDLSFPAKVVFAALMDFEALGQSPGVRTVARAIGRPKDTNLVLRAQEELAAAGEIAIEPGLPSSKGSRGRRTRVRILGACGEQAPIANRRLPTASQGADPEPSKASIENRQIETRQRDIPPIPPPRGRNGGTARQRRCNLEIGSNEAYRQFARSSGQL